MKRLGTIAPCLLILPLMAAGHCGSDSPPPADPGPVLSTLLDDHVVFSREANASLTIRWPDGTLWNHVSGLQDVETGEPIHPGAAFRVGSGIKPLVASIVFQLAEEGRLTLEDPLGLWLGDYPEWKDVTLAQLVGMTSGIPDYILDQLLWLKVISDPWHAFTPQELLAGVSSQGLEFPPGTVCLYSNSNYVLLGLVLEAVTGMAAHDLIRTRIVEPLGLEHTYLDMGDVEDTRLVHGYMDPRTAFLVLDIPQEMLALVPPEYLTVGNQVDCAYVSHPSLSWTAGALVTTTADLAVFMHALLTGQVVGPDSLARMKASRPCDILGETSDYGLGLMHYDTPHGEAWGHGGLVYGYTGKTTYLPQLDLVYSHLHGAYPGQSGGLVTELHRALQGPGGLPLESCPAPAGFSGHTDEPRIDIRFRGIVMPSDLSEVPGTASPTLFLDGVDYPLYGGSASATMEVMKGSSRMTIRSTGPPRSSDHHRSLFTLEVASDIHSSAGVGSVFPVGWDEPGAPTITVQDVWLDPDTGQESRRCVAAVPDTNRPASFYFCGRSASPIWSVDLVRFFATAGMAVEDAAMDAYLENRGLPRCTCRDESGVWSECQDTLPEESKRASPLSMSGTWQTNSARVSPPMADPYT